MHNCSTLHKGKTHRRRNRFLKKTRDPLQWWDHSNGTWKWGMDKAHESVIFDPITSKPARVRKDDTINSGGKKQEPSDTKQKTSRLVETAPASALSWLQKKVPLFGGGRT